MANNCTGAIEYGDIIYASHLIPIGISLVVAFFVFKRSNLSLLSLVFLIFVLNFCIWLGLDTITWVSTDYYLIIGSWIPLDLVNMFFYIFGLYFFYVLVDEKDISWKEKTIMFIFVLPIWLMVVMGKSTVGFDETTCEVLNNEILTTYKLIMELSIVILIITKTIHALNNTSNQHKKKQILFVAIALVIFLLTFSVTEFISSKTGVYEINLYSLFILPIFLLVITFSIINLNIFKIRITNSSLLVHIIIVIIGLQTFIQLSNIYGYISDIIIFTTSISFGLLLIKNIKLEEIHLSQISSLAAELKALNSSLSEKVTEQTMEINKAYELEKKAKRDLEKLNATKDQFIMMTQHNLRIPVTNIRNKFNLIANNIQNPQPEIQKTLTDTKISIDNLNRIADDLLNITKIKIGSQILNLSISSIKPLIENTLDEIKIDIENMRVKVTYPTNEISWPNIKMDVSKIKEVLLVIIENAIRYNKKDGQVKITTEILDEDFKIEIENTGLGITQIEKENLFDRSYYRSKRAQLLNPTGMGIGLSISKSIVEAHHGTLEIDSLGESMGAKVTLIIPFDFLKKLGIT